ncbi:efflux RND transporter permease subunit [uncultured Roseovarius sp.]|uniref:efflux RND transporter permease subunit n=1 Tax=uncultured Roseovarius sp. TaxID=293344 RepID=UPI002593C4F7|nr:efflux RND transporter permease subunit [uncultured Roseovarius sp.]
MIAWFVRHPTAANLLLILIATAGIMAAPTLKRETFPDFRKTEAEISVVYRGATAGDVEDAICRRVWDAVESVEYLDELTCTAQENAARAVATMQPGGNVGQFVNDLRTEVSAVDDFPVEADPPVVRQLNRSDAVVSVAVAGDMPPATLEHYASDLQDRLAALPDVASVTITGFGERQYRITVPRAVLEQHGLTAAGLADRIGAQSLDRPLGSLETDRLDIALRFADERRTPQALAQIVILSKANGAELTLGQIAQIEETFSPDEKLAILDGQRAAFLQVNKSLGADALRVFDDVQTLIDTERRTLPPTMRIELIQDMTSIVRDRLAMLVQNGVIGLILVIAVMSLFFRPGFAIWAALGLPVAFLGAFIAMALTGLSLNMITLVALLMAIGIVMDDSIVISDSIAEEAAQGAPRSDAAIAGTKRVLPGVLSSFATTVAIFAPLSFLAGDLGAVLEVLPVVLIAALAASLLEAFWVLPHHLSHGLHFSRRPPSRFREGFEKGFGNLRDNGLGRLVDKAVQWRYATTGMTLAALIITVALLRGGYVQREALPEIDGDVLEARILMPQGTPLHQTTLVTNRVIAALNVVNQRLSPRQPDGEELVQTVQTIFDRNLSAGENGTHVATVSVDLLGAEKRTTKLDELITTWRTEIGELPGVLAITLTEPGLGPQGQAIEIRLSSPDLDDLHMAAIRLVAELETYSGVYNTMHDLRPGRPELRLTLAEGATGLGLTGRDVAGQIGAAFLGRIITTVQDGDVSHEIELEQSPVDRNAFDDLTTFELSLPDGTRIPLTTATTIEETRGWGRITHVDGQRTVTVAADVDGRIGNADEIVTELNTGFLLDLVDSVPGLQVRIEGQNANSAQTMGSILRGFLIGLVGIYVILSFQFRSYLEPIIVMMTIPLALVGVVLGHLAMGYNISMPSIMGAASLAGIVVNNAILLVQAIDDHKSKGAAPAQAVGSASRDRFRPIVVSVTTTIMGMAPLLLETSIQAQTVKPLVISVVFGLLSATLLVLLVLPAFYAILDDFRVTKDQQ